ncbi:MAG: ribbon-helix-helix protein, CopG family [Gemmatimonadetes bacterium]|nr:ribbon-helix-helix protein, CopG family [Gemmatimonadota bacterium]
MSNRLQILVSKKLDSRLRKAADREQVSMGEWVRRAIEERLEQRAAALPDDPLAALQGLCAPTADIDDMLAEIECGRT